jgi:hypothetical protein
MADLYSGRSEPLVRGFPVLDYDISADGRQVVMSTTDREGKSRLWAAPLDPRRRLETLEKPARTVIVSKKQLHRIKRPKSADSHAVLSKNSSLPQFSDHDGSMPATFRVAGR